MSEAASPNESDASPSRGWKWRLALWGVALLLVIAGAWSRPWSQMTRPFEQDELVTFKATSFGPGETQESLTRKPRPDVKGSVVGFWRPFTDPWSPNFHVVNNCAVSLASLVGGYREATARMPALLTFLGLTAGMVLLARRVSGSVLLAALLGAALVVHPYFFYYSVTARGYVMTAALFLAQLWLLYGLPRRLALACAALAGVALLSVLTFLNTVSMLWAWVLPLVLAVMLRLRQWSRERGAGESEALESTMVVWCSVWFFAIALDGMFVVLKMRDFMSAQDRWGIPMRASSLPRVLRGVFEAVFPDGMALVALLGLVAAIVVARAWRRSWLLVLLAGGVAMNALYAVLSRKLPYERTFGPFFIAIALLIAEAWRSSGEWKKPAMRGFRALAAVLLLGAIGFGAKELHASRHTMATSYASLAAEFRRAPHEQSPERSVLCLPWIWDMAYYLPEEPSFYSLRGKLDAPTTWYFFAEKSGAGQQLRTAYWNPAVKEMMFWPLPETLAGKRVAESGEYVATAAKLAFKRIGTEPAVPEGTLFFALQTEARPLREVFERLKKALPDHAEMRVLPQLERGGMMILFFPTEDFPRARMLEIAQQAKQLFGGELGALIPAE